MVIGCQSIKHLVLKKTCPFSEDPEDRQHSRAIVLNYVLRVEAAHLKHTPQETDM